MNRQNHTRKVAVLVFLSAVSAGIAAPAATQGTPPSWRFGGTANWAGWQPNATVTDIRIEPDHVSFQTTGNDPIIVSPLFDWPRPTNGQHVEIDLDCEAPGEGEFFFTNTTQGPNGGFTGQWFVPVNVPVAGRQIVPVWPFWETLGKIVHIRFDPPGGMRCRLYGIRIVGDQNMPGTPAWKFNGGGSSWSSMYAARLEPSPAGLRVQAVRPMALIATGIEPFAAERRSILRLDADCPGEHTICFYWANRESPGLWGEPIDLPADGHEPITIDLRQFPEWKGTITNLAIGFGTFGKETLTLRSLAIEENDAGRAFLRARYFGYASGVARPGRLTAVRITLEHAGGPPLAAGKATVATDDNVSCPEPTLPIPAMTAGDRIELSTTIIPRAAGKMRITLSVAGQSLTRTLRVDPPIEDLARGDYAVPPPKPVKTDYQIGIYYFPGWSPDRIDTWKRQITLPERDSLLGWYEEGRPEVADWHIKWAIENGLSFFVYDWYWRDGQEQLGAALDDGFLKARYNDCMKFAVMWANHKPFSSHTHEQLQAVTDYWIEHYLRRPNYLTVDGKPYVIFYSPDELLESFKSPAKVREELDAIRERARAAGLPGLHIGVVEIPSQIPPATFREMGFDSFTAYNYIRTGSPAAHSLYRQYLINCRTRWQQAHDEKTPAYIPLMGVGWDGPIWYGPRSERRRGRRTEDFAEGLGQLKNFLDTTNQRMAILEAWNEFGEGSYLEPNLEFGFGDLEAVRKTFAQPGDWPVNIGPEDVGRAGQYDLRTSPARCRAAEKFGKVVDLAGVNPAVKSGLSLRCWEDCIMVEPGQATVDDRTVKRVATCVIVPPTETRDMEWPITVKAGETNKWMGGNRLIISPQDQRILTPGSYTPDSLRLVDAAKRTTLFEPKRDYLLDDTWGAFAITNTGRLKVGEKALARYRMSLRRVDALVLDTLGQPRLIPGAPSADCPEPPAIPAGTLHLANVYRPFNATTVEPEHIYPVTGVTPDLTPIRNDSLAPLLARLREGKDVTVVCWGDSVTSCGESSTPAKCYVALFESMLKERFPKARIKVINAGIGGSSTLSRLKDFQKEVLDFKPDLVTLEFVNDMGLPVEMLQKHYSEILTRTQQAGAALIIQTPHFVMPSWMNFKDNRRVDPRPGVAFLRKFASEHNVPLADASKRWELLARQGIPYETLLRNGINHPEDRGHRIFAEELMRFFPEN